MSQFDPSQIPRSEFENNIVTLESLLADQRAACDQTERQLNWWRDGLALYGGEKAEDGELDATDNGTNGTVTELIPSMDVLSMNGVKPTARQGIMRVMLDGPSQKEWPAAEIIAALNERGWMPGGAYAENTVRNKIRALVKLQMLKKVRYGTYALTPAARSGELIPEGT